MPAAFKLALAILAVAMVVMPAPAGAASAESAVRHAASDLKSALRQNDGERACGRMTARLRKQVLAAIVKQAPALEGTGCVKTLDVLGSQVYDEYRREPTNLRRLRVRGSCAQWVDSDGDDARARKQGGRWKLDGAGRC